jgi:hypothetical protein
MKINPGDTEMLGVDTPTYRISLAYIVRCILIFAIFRRELAKNPQEFYFYLYV